MASRWTIANNVIGTITTPGRYGYGKMIVYNNPAGNSIDDRLDLGSNYTAIGGSMTFLVETVSGDWGSAGVGESIFSFLDSAAAVQCSVHLDSAGNFHLRRGATTIASSTGGGHIAPLDIVQLEWELVLSDTVGTFKFWVNNSLIINASGLDTVATANVNVRHFSISPTNGLDTFIQIDNLILTDGPRVGAARRVLTLSPTSDTADKDFTAPTGTDNFAVVDETPLNTADFVQASAVGDKDLYGFENLPVGFSNVDAVSLVILAAKTDAVARELRGVLKSNATESATPNSVLGTTLKPVRGVFNTDPNGGVAWTSAAVDALTAGPELMV
jgi:hypothetical protein